MPTRSPKPKKQVATLTYEDASRKNIPTAEYQSVMEKAQQSPVRVAMDRRNRDLDPQLVWRGKDEQDWSDLVVHAPPLYIQEKVHPKVLIDDLLRRSAADAKAEDPQLDLFADFNGIAPDVDKTDFYHHDQNWSNRMILGDSLQVMASLAEREGLRGKVQCIYLDPPYGIKFNSNFQWSTTSRDVKDGNADHITREPEQVKAFRDTWRDGIHSYLTYLRDRLTVARDLLTDSGSIFVQIGDENVHRVRALMDEVFGERNFCRVITFKKTTGQASTLPPAIYDYIVWYAKDFDKVKSRTPMMQRQFESETKSYTWIETANGSAQRASSKDMPKDYARRFMTASIVSSGASQEGSKPFDFNSLTYKPAAGTHWITHVDGLARLNLAGRLLAVGKTLSYKRYADDYSVIALDCVWNDTLQSTFAIENIYVVQTYTRVIQRCLLMATDPGDLVLDPTCGSGTTAYVAEQWGRRWITIDTSRVALALARARIMGARYPYYLLADSPEGQAKEAEITRTARSTAPTQGNIRHGFVYERVPHITLKSIANNTEIDVIWEKWQRRISPLLEQLSSVIGDDKRTSDKHTNHRPQATDHSLAEWEIPHDFPKTWPDKAKPLHSSFWEARVARQKEIDASIAAKAESEYLYDKPYDDKKKVRVAGPFTVESISPHRVLAVDFNDELIDPQHTQTDGYKVSGADGEATDFAQTILETLKVAGVQQSERADRIEFTSIAPWPGHYICAEGRFEVASGQFPVTSNVPDQPTTDHSSPGTDSRTELRAGIFIGPEFGTVSRPDLVSAAREAGDADFDVLIACAFNYEAHATEFTKLGRIPVLKARMNADLHMAGELKNTGKGNLFVIFGEPDMTVAGGQWLVTRNGKEIACYDSISQLPGLGSLEEINRSGRKGLQALCNLSERGEIRSNQSTASSSDVDSSKHSGGSGARGREGVSALSQHRGGIAGGSGNLSDSGGQAGADNTVPSGTAAERGHDS